MYFLFKLLFCESRYWVYGWNAFTAPIKWNLCLRDKITLGVPRTPWCLFIYRSVSRECCRSSRKAMRHAVCHYAWKAVIAAPLWIKTFQMNWNHPGSSSHCIFKLIIMFFILNIENMKQKDLLWFNKKKEVRYFGGSSSSWKPGSVGAHSVDAPQGHWFSPESDTHWI